MLTFWEIVTSQAVLDHLDALHATRFTDAWPLFRFRLKTKFVGL